ncbi:hypothetical protein MKK70_27915 [Methylobacterium sp. E-041]|jgi:hypothetical protein|uniref:hypothetical protein n=1 Tax=unclassified Methylobacterium TaxID=2615210 RepID=UPI001FB9D1BA|nr:MULTISPECIES: hypothetical protein [unclassified Methylobacterium]MCJ2109129.1 hypothetical protein [Methylobacterium sp. E-041]MCJ2110437.1 hypothetical protein [Methylobacterium sp. E-025]
MTHPTFSRRLAKIEVDHGFSGDIADASDAQLYGVVRAAHGDLRAKHGSLGLTAQHLRGTGDAEDTALAILIEEDAGGSDARYH